MAMDECVSRKEDPLLPGRFEGIVTVTGSGRPVGDQRDWRHEAARPALPPPLSRRGHHAFGLAVLRVQPQPAGRRATSKQMLGPVDASRELAVGGI